MNLPAQNDAAERALADPSLRALCAQVGCKPLTASERNKLVGIGLAYFADRNDGRSGRDMMLTAVGRLASSAGRLDEMIQAARA